MVYVFIIRQVIQKLSADIFFYVVDSFYLSRIRRFIIKFALGSLLIINTDGLKRKSV